MPEIMYRSSREYVKSAREVHGNLYSYEKTVYVNQATKTEIYCKSCKDYFWKKPTLHLRGAGCPKCSSKKTGDLTRTTKESFIAQCTEIHNGKYSYDTIGYVGLKLSPKLEIWCKECNSFFYQKPRSHLRGNGCTRCQYDDKRHSNEEFVSKARVKHPENEYDYSEVNFTSLHGPVTVTCNKCSNVFYVTPRNHLRGSGCPICKPWVGRYSKKAVMWLEYESKKRRIKIEHALNGGEHQIVGAPSRLYADGYNRRTNTVFEFYGDIYHGNLSKYNPRDRPHPFSNLTAKQLYQKTLEREKLLVSLGYNVVSIWESEFDLIIKPYRIMRREARENEQSNTTKSKTATKSPRR